MFGSSHSAILVIKELVTQGVSKIINFYQSPLRYAIEMGDYILHDNTGLKGTTAAWAREFMHTLPTEKLLQVVSNAENVEHFLPQCDKAIYAVGFEHRHLPFIEGVSPINYEPHTGIIAPGLFGLGIAFPELEINPLGMEEYRVGLRKFMDYATRMVPIWLQYPA